MTMSEFIDKFVDIPDFDKNIYALQRAELEGLVDTDFLEFVVDQDGALDFLKEEYCEMLRGNCYTVDDLIEIGESLRYDIDRLEGGDFFDTYDGLELAKSYDWYAEQILKTATFDEESESDCVVLRDDLSKLIM